jgi:hypothetical protein
VAHPIGSPGVVEHFDVGVCYRRDYLRTTVGTSARVFGDGVSFGN